MGPRLSGAAAVAELGRTPRSGGANGAGCLEGAEAALLLGCIVGGIAGGMVLLAKTLFVPPFLFLDGGPPGPMDWLDLLVPGYPFDEELPILSFDWKKEKNAMKYYQISLLFMINSIMIVVGGKGCSRAGACR
jgi:hypothetical protein